MNKRDSLRSFVLQYERLFDKSDKLYRPRRDTDFMATFNFRKAKQNASILANRFVYGFIYHSARSVGVFLHHVARSIDNYFTVNKKK